MRKNENEKNEKSDEKSEKNENDEKSPNRVEMWKQGKFKLNND